MTRRRNARGKTLLPVSLALGVVVTALVLAGSTRYGGLEGLLLRARIEIAHLRPHPRFVPTPLPTPSSTLLVSGYGAEPTERSASPDGDAVADSLSPLGTPSQRTGTLSHATPTAVEVTKTQAAQGSPGERAPPAVTPGSSTAPPVTTPSPLAVSSASPAHRTAAPAIQLTGLDHVWQTWNNCAPATLAMHLSYFGTSLSQADIAAVLKPNPDDKNVSPSEMAAFVQSRGLRAVVRVNGDVDRLRLLLSNGLPVLIETWIEPEPDNGMGHYRLLTGYDDASRLWTAFDSYVTAGVDASQPYQGIHPSYEDMDDSWAVFNRTYMLIYSDDQAATVQSILGDDGDDRLMWGKALFRARTDVEREPDNPFAWFNLGTDLVALGEYEAATAAYDRSRLIGLPWRMLWYQFGPFEACYETGRYEELITLADATIATEGNIEEVFYWKGIGLAAQGHEAEARSNWKTAVQLNPNFADAAAALGAAAIGD